MEFTGARWCYPVPLFHPCAGPDPPGGELGWSRGGSEAPGATKPAATSMRTGTSTTREYQRHHAQRYADGIARPVSKRVDTPAGPQLLRSDLPPATVRPARRRSGERHERSIPRPPALPAPLADPPIAPQPTHTRLRRAQSEIERLQGEIKALNDVDKMLGTSAPAKPAARRSSSRRPAAAATPVAETASDAKPTRKRRPMTAEEKKAVSERMTASWAERRKKAAK